MIKNLNHPVDVILKSMTRNDQRVAEILYEKGFSDEDLYAALATKITDKYLQKHYKQNTKTND